MSTEFFDLIFGPTEGGYVRLGLKKKNQPPRFQSYLWPQERDKIVSCVKAKDSGDIYYNPALFKVKDSGLRRDVLGSAVAWVDLDSPQSYDTAREAPWSALVASGTPGHAHAYRLAETILALHNLEAFNRELAREFNGDRSGWDANQLLRVPDTLNYKTDPPKPVKVLKLDKSQLWKPPEFSEPDQPSTPFEKVDLSELLLNRQLPGKIRDYLQKHPLECFDRSSGLFGLAATAAEHGYSAGEVYALLEFADAKWGKFTERDDKQLRLTEIVRRVSEGRLLGVTGLPETQEGNSGSVSVVRPLGVISLQSEAPQIEWVVKDVIHKKGLTLIIGPTGEGKTTIALNLALKVAGGFTSWLDFPIESSNEKILYASHEMDRSQVNTFTVPMTSKLEDSGTPLLLDQINENLHINATGYTIPLNTKIGQEAYEAAIEEGKYTGLVIDTLKSSVRGALSEEKPMTEFVDWLMNIIQKYGIWVLVLHHIRKGQQTNKKQVREIEVDDSYGAGVVAHRASSVFSYTRDDFTNLKGRFSTGKNKIGLTYTNGWIERGSTTAVDTSRNPQNSSLIGVTPPPNDDGLENFG